MAAPALRADARRNRDKLIEAATQMFTERGVNTPLEEIARQAGVGIGTLYRHFPTRDALIATVYQRETEALHAAAEDLASRLPPDQALARWLQRSLDYLATKRGLGDGLRALMRDCPEQVAMGQIGFPQTLHRLVTTAIDGGYIRADVEASDVLQALGGLYAAPDTPDWRAWSGRVLDILMDGLLAGARRPPAD